MLKTRLIPCLDVQNGRVVKGVQFLDLIDAGDPVECAHAYDLAGADELCFLDITASHENRGTILDVVARTADVCFMPITVGGGVRTLEDIRNLMMAGADKVSINTAAVHSRRIVREASEKYGAQAIVVAVDAKRVPLKSPSDLSHEQREARSVGEFEGEHPQLDYKWEIFTHGGRTPTGIDAIAFAVEVMQAGAGEILLTSMDRDGTKGGYDLPLLKAITNAVSIPVVASGGVGNVQHLIDGVKIGGASAVLAASIFHFGTISISDAKIAMQAANIPMRMDGLLPN